MFQILLTSDRKLLVKRRPEDERDSLPQIWPASGQFIEPCEGVYSFEMYGCRCLVREVNLDEEKIVGYRAVPLRQCRDILPYAQFRMAVKGCELLNNDRVTKYCGRCGHSLVRNFDGLSKSCPHCGNEVFPQVSPCIIVLVKRGNEALLVQAKSFRGNHYGLVAGFIETGETVEECVIREVREETSLDICNVKYVGSQPWPFPAYLMLAFTAEYAGGELRFADGELSAGGFFNADNLPPLPSGASIARKLIEKWLRNEI